MASKLLNDLIASRFSQLAGLQITGTVPIPQDLANEMLAELVQGWAGPPAEQKQSGTPMTQVLGLVRKIQVRAEPGVIHLDFEVRA